MFELIAYRKLGICWASLSLTEVYNLTIAFERLHFWAADGQRPRTWGNEVRLLKQFSFVDLKVYRLFRIQGFFLK